MKNWIIQGFAWAFFMNFMMGAGFPLMNGEDISLRKISITFPIYLIFGLSLSYYNHKKSKRPKKTN